MLVSEGGDGLRMTSVTLNVICEVWLRTLLLWFVLHHVSNTHFRFHCGFDERGRALFFFPWWSFAQAASERYVGSYKSGQRIGRI